MSPNANGVLVNVSSSCALPANAMNPSYCPAAPLEWPPSFLANATLATAAAGMPATVGGGRGCPTYTAAQMRKFSNYKVVWTPLWIAWMIDGTVMRNESVAVRPGYVPWR